MMSIQGNVFVIRPMSYPGLHPRKPVEQVRRASPKVGRNHPCPCGSGKKFKKCCIDKG